MIRLRILPHLILVAVVAMTAACAGTPKSDDAAEAASDYRAKIREIVTDQTRATSLVQLVDEADAQYRAAGAEAAAFMADFTHLNADYDATRDQFTALMTKHRAQRLQFAEALLTLRAKMVAGTTPQEWEALSKVRERELQVILKAELPAESPSTLTAMIGDASC